MAEQQRAKIKSVPDAHADGAESTKEALQRNMEETRESIAQTVSDIRDTVADQYQSVKETVASTLDWREQFRSHPVAWCVGALSVGYVLGNSVVSTLKESDREDQLIAQLAALGDRFSDELTKRGMSILAPALTGTILVPMLTSKINELFGVDLSALPQQVLSDDQAPVKKRSRRPKKDGGKKNGKKKHQKKKDKSLRLREI